MGAENAVEAEGHSFGQIPFFLCVSAVDIRRYLVRKSPTSIERVLCLVGPV